MLELDHGWTSTGSTAAFTPAAVPFGALESVLYCQFSTLATTNTIELQTAMSSGGPWVTEGSTTISTTGSGAVALRLTGPYAWARPNLKTVSTGAYTLRLLAKG